MSPDSPGRLTKIARALSVLIAGRTAARALMGKERAHEPPPDRREVDPSERQVPANRGAETLVAVLLLLAGLAGAAFTVVYILAGHNTQLLGLAVGSAFVLIAAALIIAGKLVVPQETKVEQRDLLLDERQTEDVVQMVEAGGEGISRRALLTGASGAAGAGLVVALVTPLASAGPKLTGIHTAPWHAGVRLVDDQGKPYSADEIQIGSFYTALPEHADPELLGSGLLVVRLPADYIHLPPARRDWRCRPACRPEPRPHDAMSAGPRSPRSASRPAFPPDGACTTSSIKAVTRSPEPGRPLRVGCDSAAGPPTDDRRLARRLFPTGESHKTGDGDLPLVLVAVAEVEPDDDVSLRDGRESYASRSTQWVSRKLEKSLLAASSWMLAEELDVDPARVPEATGATIGRHRRRYRHRLDGVGDQPSPGRQPLCGFAQLVNVLRSMTLLSPPSPRRARTVCASSRTLVSFPNVSWLAGRPNNPSSPSWRMVLSRSVLARSIASSASRICRLRDARPCTSAVAMYARTASSTIASTRSALTAARR
jgi:hypothetical protein